MTAADAGHGLRTLTILGGRDKAGRPEAVEVTLRRGDVVSIVGPTGAGKSRLLGDIECLAQGDTPSGRRVLVNGTTPAAEQRFEADRKLVAQLSQTMTFVMDLTVGAFVDLHARCRASLVGDPVAAVIACANDLAGERFGPDTPLAQLSGRQSRALMIADTALLSGSPVVLVDEIENAGIDRKALGLLVAAEKIVVLSTHDPILALLGRCRLIVRNGAIAEVIETDPAERAALAALERIDLGLAELPEWLRDGRRIDTLPPGLAAPPPTPTILAGVSADGRPDPAA